MKKITLINKYTKRILYAFFFLFLLGKNFLYAQKVGINTSAPTNDLHIISTADPVRLIGMQTGSNADSIVTINSIGLLKRRNTNTLFNSFAWRLIGNAGTNPTTNFLGTTDAQDLVFRTNNTEKVRVTSAGNVGIGIAAPTAKLHIIDGGLEVKASSATGFQVETAGATAWTNLGTSTTAPILQWYNSVNTGLGVISATGRMGVGTITPANKLHIIGEDNAADTEISSTLANNQTQGVAIKYGGIAKTGSNAVSSLDINAKGAGNIILHATASGATTSTGNVGIGTAAPAVTLDMGTRTDAVLMPRGTSAERPAAPQTGMLRYNSSLGRMEYWNGTAWVIL